MSNENSKQREDNVENKKDKEAIIDEIFNSSYNPLEIFTQSLELKESTNNETI